MAPSKSKQPQAGQRLKVIVRRLPPDLPPTVFWRTVEPWVHRNPNSDLESTDDKESDVLSTVFKQGKVRKSGKDKDSVHSRAYITFKTPEALVAFHRGYDGWSFKDKTGTVTQAVVEFAPYQKVPTAPSKADPRQGTIDQDPDFLAFQTALTAPPDPSDSPAVPHPKSTPLLDHLRALKAAQLATRRATAQALKKKKGKSKDETGSISTLAVKGSKSNQTNGGKNGTGKKSSGKDKKGKNAKGSKDPSRAATPTLAGTGKSTPSGGGISRTVSGSGTSRAGRPDSNSTSSQPPATTSSSNQGKRQDPPGIVYPPGSVGAQQAAAAKQAQVVRQQLQRQHQQQQSKSNTASNATTNNGSTKPSGPTILKNPARVQPESRSTNSTPAAPQPVKGGGGARTEIQGQRRQVGAAIGAAIADSAPAGSNTGGGSGTGSKRGRGRGGSRGGGAGGNGGGAGGTRGGRGRGGDSGRGGAAAAAGVPA
ncbi:RNA-binding protein [Sporobolomyces koalae]|uniref:RNA-binding protein n=1 Tax=Sporobolomyces koalae TaxID=500713 RepID=UPI00317B9707